MQDSGQGMGPGPRNPRVVRGADNPRRKRTSNFRGGCYTESEALTSIDQAEAPASQQRWVPRPMPGQNRKVRGRQGRRGRSRKVGGYNNEQSSSASETKAAES